MKFRLIALASCVALGSIAFGGKAQAQTTGDVPFEGNLFNACVFSNPVAGVLAAETPRYSVQGSSGVSGFSVGTAGKLEVDCGAGGGLITVAPPTLNSAPTGFTPTTSQSVVKLNGSALATDVTSATVGTAFPGPWVGLRTASIALTTGLKTLDVGMISGSNTNTPLPGGTYSYTVTVTGSSN